VTRRDSLVTIPMPAAISGLSRAQTNGFYRSTRLTPPINLIDTGHASLPPGQIVPALADQGLFIGSESSFYRVLTPGGQCRA